jgi:hypothetical protein
MKKLLLVCLVTMSSLVAFAENTVSIEDQTSIYLNAAENNALGLRAKIKGSQYYACRDVAVLKLIINALSVDAINKEAIKQNMFVLRNLNAANEYIEKLSVICIDQIIESEMTEAQKIADKISEIMSWE